MPLFAFLLFLGHEVGSGQSGQPFLVTQYHNSASQMSVNAPEREVILKSAVMDCESQRVSSAATVLQLIGPDFASVLGHPERPINSVISNPAFEDEGVGTRAETIVATARIGNKRRSVRTFVWSRVGTYYDRCYTGYESHDREEKLLCSHECPLPF